MTILRLFICRLHNIYFVIQVYELVFASVAIEKIPDRHLPRVAVGLSVGAEPN